MLKCNTLGLRQKIIIAIFYKLLWINFFVIYLKSETYKTIRHEKGRPRQSNFG
jgi:hypothetical protein